MSTLKKTPARKVDQTGTPGTLRPNFATGKSGGGISMADVTRKAEQNAKKHGFPAAPPAIAKPPFGKIAAKPAAPVKAAAKAAPVKAAPAKAAPVVKATVIKSAKTGEFVSKTKAKANPDSTFRQTIVKSAAPAAAAKKVVAAKPVVAKKAAPVKVDNSALKAAEKAARLAAQELAKSKSAVKKSETALERANKLLDKARSKKK